MSKKLIAIAFADIHIFKWRLFNDAKLTRLQYGLNCLGHILKEGNRLNVPILFGGDLVHDPKEIENKTLSGLVSVLNAYTPLKGLYAISGNHDLSEKNGKDSLSPSFIQTLSNCIYNFNCIDFNVMEPNKRFSVHGIPYMNNDSELRDAIKYAKEEAKDVTDCPFKILMLHTDAPGAKDPNGFEVGDCEAIDNDMDKYFEPFDLVLFGHIHKPQKLSNKCYMLGSPLHQVSNDKGKMGYWRIYSNSKPELVPLDFPRFIKLGEGETAPDDKNYYIPYEEVGSIEEVERGDFNISLSRTKLAKRYVKKKGIDDPAKRKALIKALTSIE